MNIQSAKTWHRQHATFFVPYLTEDFRTLTPKTNRPRTRIHRGLNFALLWCAWLPSRDMRRTAFASSVSGDGSPWMTHIVTFRTIRTRSHSARGANHHALAGLVGYKELFTRLTLSLNNY